MKTRAILHTSAAALAAAILWSVASSATAETGPAERAAVPPAVEESGETILSLIRKGGWLMVPIGVCSVLALMFAIERAVSLRRKWTVPEGLLEEVYEILPARAPRWEEQEEAAERLEESSSILGDTLRPGVLKVHRGRATAETFLQDAAAKQVHLLKRRLRPFAIVASLAPLLGLLGTIFGMIVCFETATSTDAASRTEVLARGIYGALVTTAAGLSVAIPSLVLFHYFEGKVDRTVDQIEDSVNDFLEHYFDDTPVRKPAVPRSGAAITAHATAPASEDRRVG